MTKEKVQEMKEVVLTEREEEMIKWLARNAYESIKADFWDEEKDKYFGSYMSVVTMLYQREKTDAMFFICILLDQGYNEDLAQLVTKVCSPEDGSMDLFMDEFNQYIIYDLFYEDEDDDERFDDEDFDEEEPELYDVNFDPELDEDPFAVIRIEVDKEKCPELESKMREILQVLGIKLPVFRKKEREEDE